MYSVHVIIHNYRVLRQHCSNSEKLAPHHIVFKQPAEGGPPQAATLLAAGAGGGATIGICSEFELTLKTSFPESPGQTLDGPDFQGQS